MSTRRGDTAAGTSVCYSSPIPVRLTVAVALLAAAATFADGSILWAASRAQPRPTHDSAQSAPSQTRASDRRRVFVGVVGFAALVLGLSGLWLVRRSRQKAQPTPPAEPISPSPIVTRVEVPPPARPSSPAAEALMLCPTCRTEYGRESRFCKLDGNRLVAVRDGADTRGPTGGVCPVCEQGFDPGVASCPVHDEELVPAGAHRAQERPSSQYPKICPTCGVQYQNGSGFCGADGSALVTVN